MFLPALEEIVPRKDPVPELAREPAAFRPFVPARQQVGGPVKVIFNPYSH